MKNNFEWKTLLQQTHKRLVHTSKHSYTHHRHLKHQQHATKKHLYVKPPPNLLAEFHGGDAVSEKASYLVVPLVYHHVVTRLGGKNKWLEVDCIGFGKVRNNTRGGNNGDA